MNRILFPIFATMLVLTGLTGCALFRTPVPAGSRQAVMLVTVGKEKQPRRIDIELLEESAPATVANFKDLISRRYYDGMGFHRIFPRTLVQTGDPKSRHGETDRSGTGGPGYTIPAEIRLKTDQGAVAMARLPDSINPTRASNGSQFFVCIRTMPQFNGQYTVFGKVVQGLDQLDQISSLPVNSNDYPQEKVVIRSIRLQ